LAIWHAYLSTAYTMKQIGAHFRMSNRTVSRIVRKWRAYSPVRVRLAELTPNKKPPEGGLLLRRLNQSAA